MVSRRVVGKDRPAAKAPQVEGPFLLRRKYRLFERVSRADKGRIEKFDFSDSANRPDDRFFADFYSKWTKTGCR